MGEFHTLNNPPARSPALAKDELLNALHRVLSDVEAEAVALHAEHEPPITPYAIRGGTSHVKKRFRERDAGQPSVVRKNVFEPDDKRPAEDANATSVEWSDDDFDALADGQTDLADAVATLTEYVEVSTEAAHGPEATSDLAGDEQGTDEPEDATRAFY